MRSTVESLKFCLAGDILQEFEELLQFLFVAGEVEDRPHILGGVEAEKEKIKLLQVHSRALQAAKASHDQCENHA